jgi:hypothetical protein
VTGVQTCALPIYPTKDQELVPTQFFRVLTIRRARSTKDQELVPTQFFRVLTIRRARSTKDQELVPTQFFRVLTIRRAKPNKDQGWVIAQSSISLTKHRANPEHKREDNFKNFNKWLTSVSTTDAVTARDSDQSTPRRARHTRRWAYRYHEYIKTYKYLL